MPRIYRDVPTIFPNGIESQGHRVSVTLPTRAELVAAIGGREFVLNDGQVVSAGGLLYKWNTGSTAIPDLPGLLPAGEIYITHYGAIGNGSSDDTAAQAAAFARHSATHETLHYPPGNFTTTQTLFVTSGFRIVGPGEGDATSTATQPSYAASITWSGSNSGTDYIIEVKASSSGQHVYGFHMDGISLRGANLAYGGIHYMSTRHCGFGKLWVERCRNTHVRISDDNNYLSASFRGGFLQMVAGSSAATLNATGLVIEGSTGYGSTQICIDRISGSMQNADCVVIGDCDSSLFGHIQAGANSGYYGLRFQGTNVGVARASRKNCVLWYAGGAVYAEDGSKNIIGWVNSESTSVTCASGASLDYSVIDRKNGRRFSSFRQCIDDEKEMDLQLGYAHTGSPVIGTVGGQAASGVLYDAASTESWQWTFRPPRHWHAGRVTGARILGISSAATSGNLVFELGFVARPIGTGLGTALATKSSTVAGAGVVGTQEFTITFDTPRSVTATDDTCILRLSRLGGDAADTYASDFMVISVRLLFEANVADSDKPDYRYTPSDDVATVT